MPLDPLDIATQGYLNSPLSIAVDGYLSVEVVIEPEPGPKDTGGVYSFRTKLKKVPQKKGKQRTAARRRREEEEIMLISKIFFEICQ